MADRDLRLRMIFSSTDKASGAMRAVASGSKAMAKELKSTSSELDRLNNVQNRITGFRKLKGELAETSKQLDVAGKKVSSLAREIGQSDTPTRKMATEFNRAKREAALLKDQHEKQQRSLRSLRDELVKSSISTKNLADDERKLRAEISETNDTLNVQKAKIAAAGEQRERSSRIKEKMSERADKAQNIGAASSVASLPLGLILKASADKAISSGEQLSALNITFKKSGENIEAWSTKTGLAMGRSITSIRDGAQIFGLYFNQATDPKRAAAMSKQFTILAQDMGSFFNASGADVQNALRAGLSGESEPLRRYGVFLNDNAVKAKALAIGLKPVGKEFTDQQKIMARAALIMQSTKSAQGDVARTSDSTANRIRAASEGWENLQLTIGEKLIPVLPPLVSAFTSLIEAFAGLSPETQKFIVMAALAGVAFGPLMLGISGVFRVVGAMSGGISKAIGIFKKGENGVSKFSSALKKVKDGAAAVGPKLSKAASALKKVGSAALTMGRNALTGLARFARMAAGMAVSGLRIVAGALLSVGRAALIMGRAFLLNPVTLIITAIAVAAYLIYKYWDQIVPFFKKLWAGAKAIFSATWTWIKQLFFTYDPAGLIYTHWDKITAWFRSLWGKVKSVFSATWAGIKQIFLTYHPAGMIYNNWGAITAWFSGLWGRVRGVFSGAWAGIKGMMSGWATSMFSIGGNIVDGIVRGIKAAPGAVWEALKGVVFAGITGIKNFLGIKSPSRLFAGIGGHMVDGLTVGIGARGPKPIAALAALSRGISKAIVATGTAGAIVAAPAYASDGPPARTGQGGNQYTIIVKVAGGGQNADEARIAEAIRREIAAIEADKGARARSSYADYTA